MILALRVLQKHGVADKIDVVSDGKEAFDYLFGVRTHGRREAANLPEFVLLDLRLPDMSGLQVLERIQADERTSFLPVVIFSFYDEHEDVLEGYKYGANSFVAKSVSHERFSDILVRTVHYWLNLNRSL